MGNLSSATERDRLLQEGRPRAAWQLVERTILDLPVSDGLERFLSESITLALHYLAHEEAERWVRLVHARANRAGGLTSRLDGMLRAMRLRVLLSMKRYSEASEIATSLPWEDAGREPWIVNLRLYWHLREGRTKDGLRLLGRSRTKSIHPYDLASRLRVLASFHLQAGRVQRCERTCRAALRHLRGDFGLRSRLLEIEIHTLLAQVFQAVEDLDRARREFLFALDAAQRHHHERYARTYSVELAWIETQLGNHREAKELLDAVSRFSPRTPWDLCHSIRIFQARATIAVEEDDVREALHGALSAQEILDAFPDERLQAYNDFLRGRIAKLEDSTDASGKARVHLELAEKRFRALGARGRLGLSEVLVTRGELHLGRRETELAVRYCVESLELARVTRHLPARTRGLLLKSHLLLEPTVQDPEIFYEDVLRDLGAIQDPGLLFRVISNLYMYSWEMGDALELTDLHLQQLRKLRARLDEDIYHELYQKHVVQRVVRRLVEGDHRPRR